MTVDYRIDATDAAGKIDGAVQPSASQIETENWWMESDKFEALLTAHLEGYSERLYEGRLYGVSGRQSDNERRNSLFPRELEGRDIASSTYIGWDRAEHFSNYARCRGPHMTTPAGNTDERAVASDGFSRNTIRAGA